MSSPIVSVVIVNWNGLGFLKKCLPTVYAQTFGRFEVVLVDNGSTDGSVAYVEQKYPDIHIITNATNLGFAKANNQGMDSAIGRYIVTLNNDTELNPDFIGELVRVADASSKDVGMFAPKILSMEDGKTIDSVGGLLVYPDCLAKGRGRLSSDAGQYDRVEETLIPSACAAMYKKEMLDIAGLFDDDFFAYCEDTDLGLRCRLAGFKTVSVPSAVCYHYYSGTTGRYTPKKAYLVERNRAYTAIKCLPLSMLALSVLYTAARFGLQAYGAVAGKGAPGRFASDFSALQLAGILFKAYIDVFRNLSSLLEKRSAIAGKNRISTDEFKHLMERYRLTARQISLIE